MEESQKQKANNLRKGQKYQEAEAIYKNLYEQNKDRFDAAGYLHCLRKQKKFDEAISIADSISPDFFELAWCRNEAIWTYIQGIIMAPNSNLDEKINTFKRIIDLKPDITAVKVSLFKIFKDAKKNKKYDFITEHLDLLRPEDLDDKPMTSYVKSDWSDRALWYYYKIETMIINKQENEAINLIDNIIDNFPKQSRFLLRFKGKALANLGLLDEALHVYNKLCSFPHPDWWIMAEYGSVLIATEDYTKALDILNRASGLMPKLDMKVSLLHNLGIVHKALNNKIQAYNHLYLAKLIRQEKNWSIPDSLIEALDSVVSEVPSDALNRTIDELHSICRKEWHKSAPAMPEKKQIIGSVILGAPDKPFCFIKTDQKASYFCYKKDLPENIQNNQQVIFDLIPSFDKKKQKESLRAVNIRKYKKGEKNDQ